jgi:hypothetical protein
MQPEDRVRRSRVGVDQRITNPSIATTPVVREFRFVWEERPAGTDARRPVCLATVPTGADEAADRRLKFYELRDNLVRFPEWQQAG